jgi:CAP-Gly domain/ABC transporter transmembrane region
MNEQEEESLQQQQQQQQQDDDDGGDGDDDGPDDDSPLGLSLMDPVLVRRNSDWRQETLLEGVVGYLGRVDFAEGNDWVGVRLTGSSASPVALGKNNGTVQGRFYFDAPPNCGLFVRQAALERRILTKRQEIQLRRDYLVGRMLSSSSNNSTPPSRSSHSNSTTTTTPPPASTSPRKVSAEKSPRQQQADATTAVNTVSPSLDTVISRQTMARTPFISNKTTTSAIMSASPNSTDDDKARTSAVATRRQKDSRGNGSVVETGSNNKNNNSEDGDGGVANIMQTMVRTPMTKKPTAAAAELLAIPLPDTATKNEVQAWIQGLAAADKASPPAAVAKLSDTDTKRREVQAWVHDLAAGGAASAAPGVVSPIRAAAAVRAAPPGDDDTDEDNSTIIMVLLPDMAAENKPVRLWDNNEISPVKSVKSVIDVQQQQHLPSSPSLLQLPDVPASANHESPATNTREPATPQNGENRPQQQPQQQCDSAREQEQEPDYSYTPAVTARPERLVFNSASTTGEAQSPSSVFLSPRLQQHVRARRTLGEPQTLQKHDESEMTKCQAWTTLLFTWINIFPLLGLVGILLWKPSLIFPHQKDQDGDYNAADEHDESSFVTMLSGGLLLGQTLSHMILLLPLTGDCIRACCCCWYRSSNTGIRAFSVNASRLATVGTAWTGLVLLLSTMVLIKHERPSNGQANGDDDGFDSPLFILLSASGMTLVLSCLSLMISFLPCSASTTTSSETTRAASGHREGLLEPLLAATSDNDQDEESPRPVIVMDDTTHSGDEQVDPAPTSRLKGTRRLLQLASSQVFYLYSGCVVLLIRLPFSISIPHFVSTAISALAQGQFERARHEVFYLLILGSIDAALDFWGFFLFGYANLRIVRDLRLDLFWRLLNMEVGFFDANNTGESYSKTNGCIWRKKSGYFSVTNMRILSFRIAIEPLEQ